MSEATFIVGIDLGTTHCALAYVEPRLGPSAPINDFPIVQLVRPGERSERPLLPSCVYLPAPSELDVEMLRLPWSHPAGVVIGELARWQGAQVPGRLIASAKSWLCHPGVDRQAPILPWGAPEDVEKLSPVEASTGLLRHLAHAWDHGHPDAPLSEQEVVVTVPASFDEAARALTVNAIRAAGLSRFTLLEEPLAAFYDYSARHRVKLGEQLAGVRLVLVVDVGGGTTDFSLVQVELLPEGPALKRIAVGDHLLLGGDNMDAALAHHIESTLEGRKLSAVQWTQLVSAARGAKEALLSMAAPDRHRVAIGAGAGRLLGTTLSSELKRAEVEHIVLDGFFPRVAADEGIQRSARMAIQELGLPFAQDAAVTRHLTAFLRRHADAAARALGGPVDGLPRPDALLLNGGVFNSPAISQRLLEVVSALWPNEPQIPLLRHHSLELAVARGAAYSGLARRGLGLKIGGGAARAYYVALSAVGTGPGIPALCLVPRGCDEGTTVTLSQSFRLALGRPVQFQLFSTTSDRVDMPGNLVDASSDEFQPLPPLHTVLTSPSTQSGDVPVKLEATLTEIGTLELSCAQSDSNERWRLEFELRGSPGHTEVSVTESMPSRFSEAVELVSRVYGNKPLPLGPKDVKQLFRNLEHVLGAKDGWRVPLLRELWTTLFAGKTKRRRSSDHERIFFQLLGYSLRPGFGYPLDAWRCSQSFQLFAEGVNAHTEKAVWIEFWVLWRRIAPGLGEPEQLDLWNYLSPHLERRLMPSGVKSTSKPKGILPEGLEEMVRTAASLEHLPIAAKTQLGGWIVERVRHPESSGGPWAWSLGRLGARSPLYGSGHKVVPPQVAEEWLALLLQGALSRLDGAAFATAQLARLTGDRTRDVRDALRRKALEALTVSHAPENWLRMVSEVIPLEAADEARALGDTLPAGLQLA